MNDYVELYTFEQSVAYTQSAKLTHTRRLGPHTLHVDFWECRACNYVGDNPDFYSPSYIIDLTAKLTQRSPSFIRMMFPEKAFCQSCVNCLDSFYLNTLFRRAHLRIQQTMTDLIEAYETLHSRTI